jgi:hypothetical protein
MDGSFWESTSKSLWLYKDRLHQQLNLYGLMLPLNSVDSPSIQEWWHLQPVETNGIAPAKRISFLDPDDLIVGDTMDKNDIISFQKTYGLTQNGIPDDKTKAMASKVMDVCEFILKSQMPPSASYEVIGNTHVIRINPADIKAALSGKTLKDIKYENFVNANFFSGTAVLGWLISDGKILNRRDEYKVWKGNPKGTLIIDKNGRIEVGWKWDSEIAPITDQIQFCCQGFNLYPVGMDVWSGIQNGNEGWYDPLKQKKGETVGRTCNRVSIGFDGKNIILAVRPNSDASRAVETMSNLGCKGSAICLDSGESTNLRVNGKDLFKTSRKLPSIIYW